MKKRIIRGCLRIATLAVAGGVLGWLSSSLFGVSVQLIKDRPIAVTLGAGIGILSRCRAVPGEKIVADRICVCLEVA